MSESINSLYIKNNEIIPTEDFKDDDILQGTSLYEVIRIINGVPLFLENHIGRVFKSAEIKNLKLPYEIDEIKIKLLKLIECNKTYMGNIKFIFNFGKECNFYAYFIKHNYPTLEEYEKGVSTILFFGERKDPNAKVINLEFRKKVEEAIKNRNVYEAILVNNSEYITEGSKSNIFMIKDKTVFTAPKEEVLMGITRDRIIEICQSLGYQVVEKQINYKELSNYDALFISGTSPKALGINKVDELTFNSSSNIVLLNIIKKYDEIIRDYINHA